VEYTSPAEMSSPIPVVEKYAPSASGSSEASDILDLKDDEGWEDAEPDEEEEHYISLLDDEVFTDVTSMLNHCIEKYNFDFLKLRQRVAFNFYDNVKLVNFIRSQVHSGHPVSADISREDFADDKFLKPVLEDDALLISLDDLDELPGSQANVHETAGEPVKGELVSRISELEEELRRMQSQFDDYRETVKQTLDDRWNDTSTSGPSESKGVKKEEKRDDDSHYFNSYSYNGQSCLKILLV
jgi:protein arginine N-methyltransferase 3